MAKRKLEDGAAGEKEGSAKKVKDNTKMTDLHANFRNGLFNTNQFEEYRSSYVASQPYKHGVMSSLIDDSLLRRVRQEIVGGIHFTEKETDIYKIHQSGDLANLDGLDGDSLKQLPSLLELRNAMYSAEFRDYISRIANAGPLSGRKTDMAINVYTPGSHLLCHDDVIGSRRVSYILYLTDPDNPWRAEWGGALRLYPTRLIKQDRGPDLKTPDPDFSVSIPPAWNQMSFFSVQPGQSFHDVEEVYHSGDPSINNTRVRMAISGWYHIPQKGEEGFVDGAEEELATSSSLTQLQTKDVFDLPQSDSSLYPEYMETTSKGVLNRPEDADQDNFTEGEIDYLLQFMSPNLLTPDGVGGINAAFQEASCIRVDDFLGKSFAKSLREEIEGQPREYLTSAAEVESSSPWKVARPPHKQRYLFMAPTKSTQMNTGSKNPSQMTLLTQLLTTYIPSPAFRKWLRLATSLVLRSYDVKARRFRHGMDYQLATSYDAESPRLELTLGITPGGKWETEDQDTNGKDKKPVEEEVNNGGYEVWMAPDDDDDDDDDGENEITNITSSSNGTGASGAHILSKEKTKSQVADPAIYQATTAEDDGILFYMAAGWNRLSLVLRDSGTHRFVKYVSKAAGADRWDVVGDWEVDWDATPEVDDEEENDQGEIDDAVVGESEEDTVVEDRSSDEDDTDNDDDDLDEKIRMSFTS